MYKIETLRKLMVKASKIRKSYETMSPTDIKICLTNGNRKIGKVLNVSLMPIMTCGNCKECKHLCYDVKACLQYRTVLDARIRNTVLAMNHRDEFFARIDEKCRRRRKNKFFRWHVSGDILDLDYFERMVKIAKNHPTFIFWTYTKMYNIVNEYCRRYGKDSIPSNFTIMFSEWDGMKLDNPFNFPIFTVRLKDGNVNHTFEWFDGLHKCPGNCDICKKGSRGCVVGESTFVDEH